METNQFTTSSRAPQSSKKRFGPIDRLVQKQILELCKSPKISIPAMVLFVSGFVLTGGSAYLYAQGLIPLFVGVLSSTVACYLIYTCLHEAVHNCISSNKAINKTVGWISGSFLFSPFEAFRFIHLEHHRYTNHPEKDPDMYSAKSFLPLRWLTQSLYYYGVYWSRRRKLPWKYRIDNVVHLFLNVSLAVYLWNIGYDWFVLYFWLVPAFLSVFFLALFFNYLPHHPHDPELQTNQYTATNVRIPKVLTPIFLYQNYHLVHHLYSHAPFYNYIKIWRLGEREFTQRGSVIKEKLFEL